MRFQLGCDKTTYSIDPSCRLIYNRNNKVLSANIQIIQYEDVMEGVRVAVSIKELSTTEIYAASLSRSPNGRFVTVVCDGEYIGYTALAWRSKALSNGNSFACAGASNTCGSRGADESLHIQKVPRAKRRRDEGRLSLYNKECTLHQTLSSVYSLVHIHADDQPLVIQPAELHPTRKGPCTPQCAQASSGPQSRR